GRDAVGEEARVDLEARREPVDRLLRRAGLPALDLRDVLLREAIAGELRLRQARGDAELAQTLAEARGCGGMLTAWCVGASGVGHGSEVFSILDRTASGT